MAIIPNVVKNPTARDMWSSGYKLVNDKWVKDGKEYMGEPIKGFGSFTENYAQTALKAWETINPQNVPVTPEREAVSSEKKFTQEAISNINKQLTPPESKDVMKSTVTDEDLPTGWKRGEIIDDSAGVYYKYVETPDGWRITENDEYISPTGQPYSKLQIMMQQDIANDVITSLEKAIPDIDAAELIEYAESDPEKFIKEIQEVGDSPEVRAALKKMGMGDDDIGEVFPNKEWYTPVVEFGIGALKVIGDIIRPIDTLWTTSNLGGMVYGDYRDSIKNSTKVPDSDKNPWSVNKYAGLSWEQLQALDINIDRHSYDIQQKMLDYKQKYGWSFLWSQEMTEQWEDPENKLGKIKGLVEWTNPAWYIPISGGMVARSIAKGVQKVPVLGKAATIAAVGVEVTEKTVTGQYIITGVGKGIKLGLKGAKYLDKAAEQYANSIIRKSDVFELAMDLPTSERILDGVLVDNWMKRTLQKVAKVPVIKSGIEKAFGWRVLVSRTGEAIEDFVGRAAVIPAELQRRGANLASTKVYELKALLPNAAKQFGFKGGSSKKMIQRLWPDWVITGNEGTLEHVFSHPEAYNWLGFERGLEYVSRVKEINESILALLIKEGVPPEHVVDDWIHRVIVDTGKVKKPPRTGGGAKRVGSTPSYEKPRRFETMADGIEWFNKHPEYGKAYADNPELLVGDYITQAFKKIGDNRFEAYVAKEGIDISERMKSWFPDIVEEWRIRPIEQRSMTAINKPPKVKARAAKNPNVFSGYNQAQNDMGNLADNFIVRPSAAVPDTEKTLFVQVSSNMYTQPGTFEDYYNLIYKARSGYDRPADFMELPTWIAEAANTWQNSDVFIIRDLKKAERFLAQSQYKQVFFSAMDANKKDIIKLAKQFPGQVIVGSAGATEAAFKGVPNIKFANSLEDAARITGTEYKRGANYIHFKDTPTIPRLCMSKGCLHHCAFCSIPKGVTEVSKEYIDQQVKAIAELKSKLVYIDDKTFGQAGNYQYLEQVKAAIKQKNPAFEGFIVQTTAAQFVKLDEQFLERSGIKYVELGVESFNDTILKSMNKPANEEIIAKAVDKLRKNNIKFIPNIMVGLPGETVESYAKTLNFLRANADVISHVNVYNVALYEGTPLAERLGIQIGEDVLEGVTKKSFRVDTEIDERFFNDVIEFAKGQLRTEEKVGIQFRHMGVRFPNDIPAMDSWNKTLEHNILRTSGDTRSEAAGFVAVKLENAGDILREMGKDFSDGGYIIEKINKIKREINVIDWTLQLKADEKTVIKNILDNIAAIPEGTEATTRVKRLLTAIANRDKNEVKTAVEAVEDLLFKTEATEAVPQMISPQMTIREQMADLGYVLSAVKRAGRGEVLPSSVLSAIQRRNTELYDAIVNTMALKPATMDKIINEFGKQLFDMMHITAKEFKDKLRLVREGLKVTEKAPIKLSELDETLRRFNIADRQRFVVLKDIYKAAYKSDKAIFDAAFKDLLGNVNSRIEAIRPAYNQAKAAYSHALEQARMPAIGEGYLPQPFATGKIYKQEFIDAFNKFLGLETGVGALNVVSEVSGLLRITKASLDISAMAIQGLPSWGLAHATLLTSPVEGAKMLGAWYKAFGHAIAVYFDPTIIYRYIEKNNASITQRIAMGGTTMTADYLISAESTLAKGISKLPVFDRASLSFATATEVVRDEFWKLLSNKAMKNGTEFELARILDRLTGVFGSKEAGIPLSIRQLETSFGWFAPNYTRSCLSVVADIFRGGYTGAMTRKAIGGMLVTGALMFSATKYTQAILQGQTEEQAMDAVINGFGVAVDPITGDVSWKPTASFMTIKVGNSNIGIGGFWYGLLRLSGNIMQSIEKIKESERVDLMTILKGGGETMLDNPFIKWWYQRSSPIVGTGLELYSGRDFLGYPLETWEDYTKYILTRFEPIWMESGINPFIPWLRERGESPEGAARIAVAFAEVFGFRTFPDSSWTEFYDDANDVINKLPDSLLKEYYTADELPKILDVQNRGKLTWQMLPKQLQIKLLAMYPELNERYEVAEADSQMRNSPKWKQWDEEQREAKDVYYESGTKLVKRLRDGELTTGEMRRAWGEYGQQYGISLDQIEKHEGYQEIYDILNRDKKKGENIEVAKIALQEYQTIIFDDYEDENGEYDFDAKNAKIDAFIAKYTQQVYDKIREMYSDKRMIEGLDPLLVRYSNDSDKLSRSGYWDLPYQAIYRLEEKDVPEQYKGLWLQYKSLTTKEQRDAFIEGNPDISRDWKAEWRQKHPKEDALLALWGYGGKIQSREAYDELLSLAKELNIPLSQISATKGLPTAELADKYYEYNKITVTHGGNSAEAKLYKLENKDFFEWGKKEENYGWSDIETPIGSLKITAKWRDLDNQYDAIGDRGSKSYVATTEGRKAAREKLLAANTEYAKDRLRRNAYDDKFPENLIGDYVEWYSVERKGYDDDWFLMENQDFYKAMVSAGKMQTRDFTKVPSKQILSLYEQYEKLPAGKTREAFRRQHSDLDAWMVKTGKVSKPIGQK